MLPLGLLAALFALHLTLGIGHHLGRACLPGVTNHLGYKNIVELRRLLEGEAPLGPLPHPGRAAFFIPAERRADALDARAAAEIPGGLWGDPSLIYWIRAPQPFLVGAALAHLAPGSALIPSLWPMLWLALLLASLYALGSRLGGPWVGLCAAAVASGYPAIFGFARLHHDALPLAAWGAAAAALVLYSEGLRRWGCCVGAALALGCGLRSGESLYGGVLVGMIAAGPAAAEAAAWIRAGSWRDPRAWAGPTLGILTLALLVDWRWLGPSLSFMLEGFDDLGTAPRVAAGVPAAWAPLIGRLAYLPQLGGELLRPALSLWALLGLGLALRRPLERRLGVLLMAALPLAALSWMTRKATWYAAPTTPALALITAAGLATLQDAGRRRLALGAASLSGVAALLFHSLAPDAARSAVDAVAAAPLRRVAAMRSAPLTPPAAYEGILVAEAAGAVARWASARPGEAPVVIALIAPERPTAHAVRYLVELEAPRARVVSLLDRNLMETGYAGLGPASVDALVYVNANGLRPWDPRPGAPPPADFHWASPWPEVGDPLPAFLEALLREREAEAVEAGGILELR